jgi:hypothetical protein
MLSAHVIHRSVEIQSALANTMAVGTDRCARMPSGRGPWHSQASQAAYPHGLSGLKAAPAKQAPAFTSAFGE